MKINKVAEIMMAFIAICLFAAGVAAVVVILSEIAKL